jgi:hemolysin III
MILALVVTAVLWRLCGKRIQSGGEHVERAGDWSVFERGKSLTLLIFGMSLVICYGTSALYHAVHASGELLGRLRRLDHLGIYLLIAGTYTPAAWSLLRGPWRRATLATVWTVTALCMGRVWLGAVLPAWMSTLIYLGLGWGALFCYRELTRDLDDQMLLPLPLGGAFYSVGAVINLVGWPVMRPGVLGAHDLFHFFVIAGSACHVMFMLRVVVPASQPAKGPRPVPAPPRSRTVAPIPVPLAWGVGNWRLRLSLQSGGALYRRPRIQAQTRAEIQRLATTDHAMFTSQAAP